MKWFKKLFCNHFYLMTRWHWCHGPNGNDPRCIEREFRCVKCGKMIYDCITSDMCDLDKFAEINSEKQEF
jgi:hypothetical protein